MANQQSTSVDRRSFLKIAGMAGAALAAGATVAGCSSEKAQATASYLPQKWDYEADIVVIGHGGAGLSAAITAYDEDLGSVIMLEAAEEEYRGGNSRVCGQNMMIPDDPEFGSKCNSD